MQYGLIYKEKIIGYYTEENNDAEFCYNTSYTLDNSIEDKLWIVDNKIIAEYVRNFSTPWFNAHYESPTNPYIKIKDEIQVAEIISQNQFKIIEVKIPTQKEFYTKKYENNIEQLTFILGKLNQNIDIKYSQYDLFKFLENNKI
jgi:hypothetical protein